MLRTIESSTSSTRLPCSTSRSGVNFSRTLSARFAALDERAADVAVADQPFDRRHAQLEGHRVGGGLAGVRHRHDDRVRRRAARGPAPAPAWPAPCPEPRPRQVDAAVVERAGDVGEVDPLEEAVRGAAAARRSGRWRSSPSWMRIISPGSSDWILRKPRFSSATLSLAAANSGPSCGVAQRPEARAGRGGRPCRPSRSGRRGCTRRRTSSPGCGTPRPGPAGRRPAARG